MSAQDDEGRAKRRSLVLVGELTAVAFEFLGAIVGGAFVGYYADRWLGTDPWLLIVGTLSGTGGGLYRMVQLLTHFQKRRHGS